MNRARMMFLLIGIGLPIIAFASGNATASTILFQDDFNAEIGSGDGRAARAILIMTTS